MENVEQKSAEVKPAQETRDSGENKPQEQPVAAQAQDTKPERTVPLAALEDERKKRQRYEQEKTRLEAELEVYRKLQSQNPQEPKKSKAEIEAEYWNDPVGFSERLAEERLAARENKRFQARLADSVEEMREEHKDYDEVEAAFAEACRNRPDLQERLRNSDNPARFAYRHGKKLLAEKQPPADMAAIKEQLRAEIMAELKGSQPAAQLPPKSQVGARGSAADTGAAGRVDPFGYLSGKF